MLQSKKLQLSAKEIRSALVQLAATLHKLHGCNLEPSISEPYNVLSSISDIFVGRATRPENFHILLSCRPDHELWLIRWGCHKRRINRASRVDYGC